MGFSPLRRCLPACTGPPESPGRQEPPGLFLVVPGLFVGILDTLDHVEHVVEKFIQGFVRVDQLKGALIDEMKALFLLVRNDQPEVTKPENEILGGKPLVAVILAVDRKNLVIRRGFAKALLFRGRVHGIAKAKVIVKDAIAEAKDFLTFGREFKAQFGEEFVLERLERL